MKNQKGITLIALVVTIVVLLILAGTSIAMLTGENGIITNAQKSTAANTEGDVRTDIEMAVNSAKTIVLARTSTDAEYDPTAKTAEDELVKRIITDLGLTAPGTITDGSTLIDDEDNYTVELSSHVITITYSDSQFQSGKTVAGVTMSPITAEITISANDVTFEYTYNSGDRLMK